MACMVSRNQSGKVSLQDCKCTICMSILINPVTLPCSHELCLPCFKQTVEEANLTCPLCRTRISTWARRAAKTNSLVNQKRWEQIQKLFPNKVQKRLSGLDDGDDGDEDIDADFRVIDFAKPGEIRQEYEAELKRLHLNVEEDREREEAESAALIEQIQNAEAKEIENLRRQQEEIAACDEELAQELSSIIQQTETVPGSMKVQHGESNVTCISKNISHQISPAGVGRKGKPSKEYNGATTLDTFFRRLPPGIRRTPIHCSSVPFLCESPSRQLYQVSHNQSQLAKASVINNTNQGSDTPLQAEENNFSAASNSLDRCQRGTTDKELLMVKPPSAFEQNDTINSCVEKNFGGASSLKKDDGSDLDILHVFHHTQSFADSLTKKLPGDTVLQNLIDKKLLETPVPDERHSANMGLKHSKEDQTPTPKSFIRIRARSSSPPSSQTSLKSRNRHPSSDDVLMRSPLTRPSISEFRESVSAVYSPLFTSSQTTEGYYFSDKFKQSDNLTSPSDSSSLSSSCSLLQTTVATDVAKKPLQRPVGIFNPATVPEWSGSLLTLNTASPMVLSASQNSQSHCSSMKNNVRNSYKRKRASSHQINESLSSYTNDTSDLSIRQERLNSTHNTDISVDSIVVVQNKILRSDVSNRVHSLDDTVHCYHPRSHKVQCEKPRTFKPAKSVSRGRVNEKKIDKVNGIKNGQNNHCLDKSIAWQHMKTSGKDDINHASEKMTKSVKRNSSPVKGCLQNDLKLDTAVLHGQNSSDDVIVISSSSSTNIEADVSAGLKRKIRKTSKKHMEQNVDKNNKQLRSSQKTLQFWLLPESPQKSNADAVNSANRDAISASKKANGRKDANHSTIKRKVGLEANKSSSRIKRPADKRGRSLLKECSCTDTVSRLQGRLRSPDAKKPKVCDLETNGQHDLELSQEEKDRQLALSLQQQFDIESKLQLTALRFKGTDGQYSLRSGTSNKS